MSSPRVNSVFASPRPPPIASPTPAPVPVRVSAPAKTKRYVPATYIGILHAGLKETESAFEWLERAYVERADGLTLLNVEPMVDGLRPDPRFQSLISRIGF
jgi:hypothetical protein